MDRCDEHPWGTCGTCGYELGVKDDATHPITGDLACWRCAKEAREAINRRAMTAPRRVMR
jgi:hypothetical protein